MTEADAAAWERRCRQATKAADAALAEADAWRRRCVQLGTALEAVHAVIHAEYDLCLFLALPIDPTGVITVELRDGCRPGATPRPEWN